MGTPINQPLARANRSAAADKSDRKPILQLFGVIGAGAIGGLLYWGIALWTGTPLPAVFGHATGLMLMLFGAAAAAFGVYLLTASDMTVPRTYIFAVVCGVAWKPVIDSAVTLAANKTATDQTQQLGDTLQQMRAANQSGDAQQLTQAVQNSLPTLTQELNASANVKDTAKRAEIVNSSTQAFAELQTAAQKAPEASVDVLTNASSTAAKAGEPSLAIRAIQSLHSIADKSSDPRIVAHVNQSLASLAQSSDPSVRAAAVAAQLK